jgi:hypothetical protein
MTAESEQSSAYIEGKEMGREQMRAAAVWYHEHQKHVEKLITEYGVLGKDSYAPTGSDVIRPELWEPAHWRWFFGL